MITQVNTIVDYEVLALRTMKEHASKELAISDWALGLGGELSEVVELVHHESKDKMELAKEMGDILWYNLALARELDIKIPVNIFSDCMEFYSDRNHCPTCLVDDNPAMSTLMELIITIGTIQERIKHIIMHKEGTSYKSVEGQIHGVIEKLTSLAIWNGFKIQDVAELNAAKLAHRYNMKDGGKYSHEASADRHAAELKFEDTATYKRLYQSITGDNSIARYSDDVEVF